MIGRVIMLVVGLWSIAIVGSGPAQETAGPPGGRAEAPAVAGRTEWQATGTQGAVSAGGRDAVAAGLEILKKGGNAADGGAATILALSVTDSRAFCFGGEVPIMVYDAQRRGVTVIAGQGAALGWRPSNISRGPAGSPPAGSRPRPYRPRSTPASRCSTGLAR